MILETFKKLKELGISSTDLAQLVKKDKLEAYVILLHYNRQTGTFKHVNKSFYIGANAKRYTDFTNAVFFESDASDMIDHIKNKHYPEKCWSLSCVKFSDLKTLKL